MEPLAITPYRLAKATGLSQSHISELLKGKRTITAETSLRLGMALGMSPEYWLGIQNQYDRVELRRRFVTNSPMNIICLIDPPAIEA